MDLKEAVKATAPHSAHAKMPSDRTQRVVEGARHLSHYLGGRMRAAKLDGKSVFVRELMPQDRKVEIEGLTTAEAIEVAGFLAAVVGRPTAGKWTRKRASSGTGNCNAVTPNRWKRPAGSGPALSSFWQTMSAVFLITAAALLWRANNGCG
jgi:uncharacterized protein (DUF2252 family)